MSLHDARFILLRLIATTFACRDAFLAAAYAVRAAPLTLLFVGRADHQQRSAEFLIEHAGFARSPHRARRTRLTIAPTAEHGVASHQLGCDPRRLLDRCIHTLDTSIQDFSRALGPATSFAHRKSLKSHSDGMRWSHEELLALRMAYGPRHLRLLGSAEQERELALHDAIWSDTSLDRSDRDAWFAELIPLDLVAMSD